jgi:2-hydroxychromene-2-carboxylate isomerase
VAKIVDYYFTTASPWTYLGHRRFERILAERGASVNVKPVDYGRIFPVSGGVPLKSRATQRQAYRLVELARWRDYLGEPLNLEPKFFPFSADASVLAVIAASEAHDSTKAMALAFALMRACWMEERNVGDVATVQTILREAGLVAEELTSDAAVEAARSKYDAYTREAIDRGVFGAPSYVIDGEIFWGQDRLDFVDRKLAPAGR